MVSVQIRATHGLQLTEGGVHGETLLVLQNACGLGGHLERDHVAESRWLQEVTERVLAHQTYELVSPHEELFGLLGDVLDEGLEDFEVHVLPQGEGRLQQFYFRLAHAGRQSVKLHEHARQHAQLENRALHRLVHAVKALELVQADVLGRDRMRNERLARAAEERVENLSLLV